MQKEFNGSLESISPSKLINKDKKDDFESFFLVLGMIFNDLKGIVFFEKLLDETYRKPNPGEKSVHMGEFSGLKIQIQKNLIGAASEFLIFLKENSGVINSPKFMLLIKKLPQDKKLMWAELVGTDRSVNPIISKLAQVRSNVLSHYDYSLENLRRGFIRSFFKESKDLPQHDRAYFSLGGSMELTRFYYSDAAVEEYIKSLVTGEDLNIVAELIKNMNHFIQTLLAQYIKGRK